MKSQSTVFEPGLLITKLNWYPVKDDIVDENWAKN